MPGTLTDTSFDATAWNQWQQSNIIPSSLQLTTPTGDIIFFDTNGDGGEDHVIPHAGSGTAGDIDTDPNSPFYGMTELQKAAYAAAKGQTDIALASVQQVQPDGSVKTVVDPTKLGALAQQGAALVATVDAKRAALDAGQAFANQALGYQTALQNAQNALASAKAAGGLFLDTLPAGSASNPAYANLQTTTDFINGQLAHEGYDPTGNYYGPGLVPIQQTGHAVAETAPVQNTGFQNQIEGDPVLITPILNTGGSSLPIGGGATLSVPVSTVGTTSAPAGPLIDVAPAIVAAASAPAPSKMSGLAWAVLALGAGWALSHLKG